jgi:hypothetical protein
MSTANFWSWFVSAKSRLERFDQAERDALLDEIQEHLQEYSPGLWFEIGGHPSGPHEFVVSAEGDTRYFDDVRALVEAAPPCQGWQFIAFKPAQGFEFTTEYNDISIKPTECWFLPLVSASQPKAIGLRIGIPGYEMSLAKAYLSACHIVLDTGLGELRSAECIHHLEVCALPPEPESEGYIALPELDSYLRWSEARDA